jgi:hypothetical protein
MDAGAALGLEPTYTAKAFAALLDDAPKLADKVVVFWATQNAAKVKPVRAKLEDLAHPFRVYGCPDPSRK